MFLIFLAFLIQNDPRIIDTQAVKLIRQVTSVLLLIDYLAEVKRSALHAAMQCSVKE